MKRKDWSVFLILAGAICIFCLFLQQKMDQSIQQGISDKVIRFHVIANSDRKQDQELKLQVRDAVGEKMQELLRLAKDRKESMEIIKGHLDEITQWAKEEIEKKGHGETVKATLAHCFFPEKTYGPYTFAKGWYDALEIRIGKGKGHNWWCVMYPNLCFQDSVYEEPDLVTSGKLRKVLTPAEYTSIMEKGNYEIKWKYLVQIEQWLNEKLKGKKDDKRCDPDNQRLTVCGR